ncbi:YcxB family protein [Agriterribacter sp.]|uniref:YcxB family protein n=1 Tax=Agriterribacter sp. TaxID=2821509 RepID=UPI002B7B18B2|nr:YcxB family protein [Agriterribacter sp.]HTN05262.1 YcxB family protein [Agriterribacter sp.]
MQVTVTYQKSLVLQALRYHFISKREIKFMIILVNVFTSVAAILFYYKKVTPLAFFISFFLWVVLMLAFWRWLPSAIYKRSATFKDSFRVSLEENHFFIENEKASKSWAWRAFSEMIETPHFFHLYFNPRSFFLLPKDAFGDSDGVHEARVFLKSKIGKQKL